MTTKVYFSSQKTNLLKGLNDLTPNQSGKWGSLERVYDIAEADCVVILEDSKGDFDVLNSLSRNQEVIAFPLDLKIRKNYLRYNFTHRYTWGSSNGRVLCSLPSKTYDELRTFQLPFKSKGVSCILDESASKEAIAWIKDFASLWDIDVYGEDYHIGGCSTYCGPSEGCSAFEDYHYSIIFEEVQKEDYFTEKLTNCLLSWCFPCYWGCPNLTETFDSPVSIKVNLPGNEEERRAIGFLTKSSLSAQEQDLLRKARHKLLTELNVWARVSRIVSPQSNKSFERPEKTFENMNVARDGICLIMIVRDEAHVIERCLSSVVNVISSYLICDTGSLDNTPEIIENFMESHGIPGQVIYKKWKNFGYNKSYLIRRAYEDNLSLGAKYLIWLDADEVFQNAETRKTLTVEDRQKLLDFANSHPDHGIFMFMTHYGGLEYQRWNMVRNNQLYKWNCPVHEWLSPTEHTGIIFVDFIINLARKEGARTKAGDSGRKDTEMFEEHLREKPNCSRCVFYLAQTLGENGDLEKAIEMYEKRLTMPGFYQENYIAAMRIGHFYMKLEKPEEAFKAWENGWKIINTRLEIPYYHMMGLMKLKRHSEAYDVATRAYNIFKLNVNDMFVEKGIYEWRFFLEYSVAAYYSQHYQRAYELGQRLMDEGKYPENQTSVVEKNMGFFRQKISTKVVPNHLSRRFNFHPPMIIVIDDFLPNPDEVREFALAQEFTLKGNYPGRRTKPFCTSEHKEAFERILGTKITYWPTHLHSYNGAFQYTFGSHKSWIHRDATDYSAMIYLTPDPPPDGGTLTYRHKDFKIERDSEATKDQLKQMNNDSSNESKWEKMDIIANKYNRLIIFSGRRSHRSNKYWGSSRTNGRLFQTFFFDVEGYH